MSGGLKQKRFAAVVLVLLIVLVALVGVGGCVQSPDRGASSTPIAADEQDYQFASQEKFDQHYQKHGREFGGISQNEYLQKANDLIVSAAATVKTKEEKTDGDTCYYDTATNEFLVLTKKGVIRTFFHPDDGIDYFNRQ